ncbi:hypothetical protein [Vibrio splendidus]|uniref:Uncharacterized protein n=1 Tax=Vibrio splendidus TaxID=29497 RepID=A0A2T5ENH3_VIBSP|nr:hypothetical protein [Vibrio splendidus]OEE60818.1 hypothetical protein A147_21490 [Vibrio splendidus FF-6]PTP22752.1 hypothetical protein CWO36_01100 [Vibrio splendidus]
MKSRMVKLGVIIYTLVSFQCFAIDLIPIDKVCRSEIIDHLEKPVTKDKNLFYYYLSLTEGSCYPNVDRNKIDSDKMIKHFARLGEPYAQYVLDKDMNKLLAKAREGDVSAQIYFVFKNTKYLSVAKSNTAEITTTIPDEEFQEYLSTMFDLADKGDARAILPTITYMIDAANSPLNVNKRYSVAHDLIDRFGEFNMMYASMLNVWKIGNYDFEICVSNDETKIIERQNMSVLCSMAFDRALYEKLSAMTNEERLIQYRDYLATVKHVDEDVESYDVALAWLEAIRTVAVYSLLDVPYSRTLMPYMRYKPDGKYRHQALLSQYWFDSYNKIKNSEESYLRWLFLLSSHTYKISNANSTKIKGYFSDTIPYVNKAYIYNIAMLGEHDKAEELYLNELFENGDIDSLRNLSSMYALIKKDPVKLKAMIDIYSEYRPELSNYLLYIYSHHFRNNLSDFESKVREHKKWVTGNIPNDAETTRFFLTWNDAVKPFVIKNIDNLINEGDKSL